MRSKQAWRYGGLILGLGIGLLSGCGDGNADAFLWGRSPAYTPDGARLLYAQNLSTPSDQVFNTVSTLDAGVIWRIDADGTDPVKITPDNQGPDFFPKVSPDGTRIAYATGQGGQFDVWVMNIDGTARRQLTFDQAVDTTPAWSPDGRRIVFVSDRTGNNDIWSVSADGSGLQQLTSFPSDEGTPSYSPDGSRIALASNQDRSNFDIWTMDADGGNLTQLTRKVDADGNISDGAPAWSPDGQTIAFERWDGNWDIYRIAVDGTGLQRLTDAAEHDGDPTFSPDGTTIAFTSARSGWWQVWLMAANGGNERQLTGVDR
ncbi:MAG: PD40 domain-containing protein [Armatimonadetes bacterium]|nr:PD40 domain-containing protein [Armatimonadota bacterium]